MDRYCILSITIGKRSLFVKTHILLVIQKRLAVLTLYIILCKQGTAKTLGLNFLIKEMSLFCMHVYLVFSGIMFLQKRIPTVINYSRNNHAKEFSSSGTSHQNYTNKMSSCKTNYSFSTKLFVGGMSRKKQIETWVASHLTRDTFF